MDNQLVVRLETEKGPIDREAPKAPRLLDREAPKAPRLLDREAPKAPRLLDREAPKAPRLLDLPAILQTVGETAVQRFARLRSTPGINLLLTGDHDYLVTLQPAAWQVPVPDLLARLDAARGRSVCVIFAGRTPVRRVLGDLNGLGLVSTQDAGPVALDLTAGLHGAPPLFLLPDGTLSSTPGPAPAGMALKDTLVTAARWISSRRTSTFAELFPPSAFHPEEPARTERLGPEQAGRLLGQLREALQAAAVGGPAAREKPADAAQVRSAAVTVLSHVLGTVLDDPGYRAAADAAAAELFALIDRETGDTARPALRAHAIMLLQVRGPALQKGDAERAAALLKGLIRQAPPYAEMTGPWRFAMCSGLDFHEGECEILQKKYGFRVVAPPADAPRPPGDPSRPPYQVLEAPFFTPAGQPIQIFARVATPGDENQEMGSAYFTGVSINRHSQLGSFDMEAGATLVHQAGYKLMMNSQCAGLTTRFITTKLFPDADIYSSWDSTFFSTGPAGKVVASEGQDCFVAILSGMSHGESHAAISERIKAAQWADHQQARIPGFVQFIGPGHPLVVARFADVNQDARADFYDGFLDFGIMAIKEDMQASGTPRDPGVPASQIGGDAARGLDWAAGSLNRVAQYSDLWQGLPGDSELLYSFDAGGFYSHKEPPRDVPVGQDRRVAQDMCRLPAVCRYVMDKGTAEGIAPRLCADVMLHSYLGHAAQELKRVLCAAEAMWRALDLGHLPRTGELSTLLGQRAAVLLTVAGLLEFPADQNFIDGLWSMAMTMLNLPPLSRSVVRACITQADHQASHYYGSARSVRQLVGEKGDGGDLKQADPVAYEKLRSDDPLIGRARELTLPD